MPEINQEYIDQLMRGATPGPAQVRVEEEQTMQIVELPIAQLVDDECQKAVPFRLATEQRLRALTDDIRRNGILSPLLVRKQVDGLYGILAGRDRKRAAAQLGYTAVPCIIKDVPDEDTAISIMVSDNLLHRTDILPSEKAFAYRKQLDILNRQGQRTDLTSCHDGQKYSRDLVAEMFNESSRQVQRYVRLTYLIPELLQLVDERKLALVVAEQLSFISEDGQIEIWAYFFSEKPKPIRKDLAILMRAIDADPARILDAAEIEALAADRKTDMRAPKVAKIPLTDLRSYIPKDCTTRPKIVQYIVDAVIAYAGSQNKGNP